MKVLKQLLFMLMLVAGMSVATMAQRDGDKQKPPPKGNPPVVVPGKPQPRETPKPDRPKKPGMEALFRLKEDREDLA